MSTFTLVIVYLVEVETRTENFLGSKRGLVSYYPSEASIHYPVRPAYLVSAQGEGEDTRNKIELPHFINGKIAKPAHFGLQNCKTRTFAKLQNPHIAKLQNPHIFAHFGCKIAKPAHCPHIGAKLQNPHICKIAKPAHWEKPQVFWLILCYIRQSNGRRAISFDIARGRWHNSTGHSLYLHSARRCSWRCRSVC
jgi:hypothetical protein